MTIVGLGEDGPEGLGSASLEALLTAEVIMGTERLLAMVPDSDAERIIWPVPFADGLDLLDRQRGRRVVVLASGDPFWFGAGSVIARRYEASEWKALPGVSVFSLAAARLGWPLQDAECLGLHAAPFSRLRPVLAQGQRIIVTLRDGAAVGDLSNYLKDLNFGDSRLYIMEALGGPRERIRETTAETHALGDVTHPVVVALKVSNGPALARASGRPDDIFDSDGQITKRPIRALTLSALAPNPGERLWDIGAGSGSIAIEWLLSHPTTEAIAIEAREDRALRVRKNADALGQDRLRVVTGKAPDALAGLAAPDAVFVGGGLTQSGLDWLWQTLAPGTRIVANAVTLDTQALLTEAQAAHGGALLKIDLAEAAPLGGFRGWKAGYTLMQWSVVR